MTQTVLILGSRPEASIPSCDAVYCANAAIGYYRDRIAAIPWKVLVVNGGALKQPEVDSTDAKRRIHEEKRNQILNAPCDERYVMGNTKVAELINEWDRTPTHLMPRSDRHRMVRRVTGFRQPIVTGDFAREPFGIKLTLLYRLLKAVLKRSVNREKDHPPYFRPSAGVLALILAVDQNPAGSRFIISGIGVSARHEYHAGVNDTVHSVPKHVGPDVRILQKLNRTHDLATTEPELAELTGIRLLREEPAGEPAP